MISKLTCFKCWKDTATLTYEENRIYKVSCTCGCNYDFEHSSMDCAAEYHIKMLELYGEINNNTKLKTELDRYKIMLFMVARIKVMEVGLGLGKSVNEINCMALETAKEMFDMIDFDRAKEIYKFAKEQSK